MAEGAHVTSLDALRTFRGRYADFGDRARQAIDAAEADVQRTLSWLQSSRLPHWRSQVTRRRQQVAIAKSELFRAELGSRDERPSAVLERKNLARAQAALDEAETKIARIRHWGTMLEREFLLFKGQLQGLAARVQGDVPRGVARLGVLIEQLEAYTGGAAPPREVTENDPERRP